MPAACCASFCCLLLLKVAIIFAEMVWQRCLFVSPGKGSGALKHRLVARPRLTTLSLPCCSLSLSCQCHNLKAIQSMGAGVDSLMGDGTLPRHVPLLRVIDPLMSERMATWVLWGVINCQVKHTTRSLSCMCQSVASSRVVCLRWGLSAACGQQCGVVSRA
jgi:hypothetical protein